MPSEKVLQQKKEIVRQLSENMKSAKTIVFADYRGLTVEQDTELRNKLRKAGVEYKVVKNTLTKLAAKENGLEELEPYFNGPTSMAFSDKDVVAPAKIMVEYAEKYENLELKVGVVEGKVCDLKTLKAIAALPPKEELVAKALGSLKSPIAGLVNVLNGNIRGLVIALNAIAEKKKESA
ncbi:MAG TPA: 50S ribosomal protein L10 [Hungateiclostridium thermocellum]|uniref:Large ribosomal subunit protein uL10 n=2 Tax=Acetivibrio thermocellus TaxID=1515 RepID=A3DIZ2_ACET2|nr:50S ribosomal protein L10 [Acetivibrio thermocellus]CDG37186.1 50S ribosomal protein L10P [Acetivibrio thermocellus BC1]ABN53921.1 ribosomal protein L10 [Acetivibrio thermocellus ATCC 27405]ADU73402.1 ribosomal protein L10 [Acetivibrio thermocellus DSM 1313]ALX07324.1 50S ribosomal protein L10 [Acetivibrio thermocellus AD2]EIC04209.1 50S ribosomal protein L10 [Acetivibrio thermocellus YS]